MDNCNASEDEKLVRKLLDDARLLRATVDLGRASGIEAAAKIVAEMANHKGRVVGTNALRDLAELLSEKAAEIRAAANAEIKGMEKL